MMTKKQDRKKHRRKGTKWIVAGIVFLLAAIIYCLHNLYLDYSAGVASQAVYEELTARMEEINSKSDSDASDTDSDGDSEEDLYQPLYVQYPSVSMPTIEIDGVAYIGILEIPSIELAIPVSSEWSYDQLEVSACRYSGSVYTHDIVICGHNYRSVFSPIKWLEEGTEAIFTDVDGNVFTYTLSYTDVIAPGDVEDMVTADGTWDLTLFTCTTGGASRMALRFVLDS